MNLLIQASLSEPPSDSLAFRYVTLVSKQKFDMNVLLLTEQEVKDMYYKYLLKKGLFDFIDGILTTQEKETGLRLDTKVERPPTIKLKAIVFENQVSILNKIKNYR
jgi:hypothetical protein